MGRPGLCKDLLSSLYEFIRLRGGGEIPSGEKEGEKSDSGHQVPAEKTGEDRPAGQRGHSAEGGEPQSEASEGEAAGGGGRAEKETEAACGRRLCRSSC